MTLYEPNNGFASTTLGRRTAPMLAYVLLFSYNVHLGFSPRAPTVVVSSVPYGAGQRQLAVCGVAVRDLSTACQVAGAPAARRGHGGPIAFKC